MKQGKTLTELATELERQNDAKRDYHADTRKLRFTLDDSIAATPETVTGGAGPDHQPGPAATGPVCLDIEGVGRMPLLATAHQQFASVNKVPKPYYDRMLAEAPDLLATNLNHWLEAEPKRRLVRTMDGQVRAFLSDRYRPLDNFDLAQAVLPKLGELEANVVSSEITPDRFYLKAVTPKIQESVGRIKRGVHQFLAEGDQDLVQAGIVVSNSEVGQGSLRVEELAYRLVCLNGAIVAKAVRKAHLGRGSNADLIDGAQEFFRDETRRLSDAAFWNQVVDTVGGLFDPQRFARRVDSMREASERTLDAGADPVKVVEATAKRLDLNDGERSGVLTHLIQGGDLSQWGLANAITRASQDIDDYTRATELEAAGGQVIELAATDWQALAASA